MSLAVPSTCANSALIFSSILFQYFPLSPCLILFSKFPFLSLLNKTYLSHWSPQLLAGQKLVFPRMWTLAKQEQVKPLHFTRWQQLHLSKMTWVNLILVTLVAHRLRGKVMLGFCLDLDLIWQWTEKPGPDNLEARWHAGLWEKAVAAVMGPRSWPYPCLWVDCHKVSGSLEL